MSNYEFFLSVGGTPTFISGASIDDAKNDDGAVLSWDFGWQDRPEDVKLTTAKIASEQVSPIEFSNTEASQDPVKGDEAVFFWRAEEKARGSVLKSWNQLRVGTCVSFGWGRGSNDLIMMMVAAGLIDPVMEDVATEPIYGGSRVEVGGGQIRGDGSVGAWAAKYVKDWGNLLRKVYGSHDLTKYSESLSRAWGSKGVPDELEPIARMYPVKSVAKVTSAQQAWDALGNGYPIPVCSNRGFTTTLQEGFCSPSGSWNHCMLLRGRVTAKRRGQLVKAFPCQNSWGNYLSGDPYFEDPNGNRIELPEGCFLIEWSVVDAMLRQDDSFAISDQDGFPKRQILDWFI